MAYWNGDHYYLHRVEEHLDRLQCGAAYMNLRFPWSTRDILEGIDAILETEPPMTYYLRPIVYRGGPELTITGADQTQADICIFGVRVQRDLNVPLRCCMSDVERASAKAMPTHCKVSGVYANSYLVRSRAEKLGFNDGLMLDRQGRIAEASAANVFFIQEGRLITPAITEEILAGVTRRVVMEIANGLGIPVAERAVWPTELDGFEGAFLCSTLLELRPIECIDGLQLTTADNDVFGRILTSFRRITHQ